MQNGNQTNSETTLTTTREFNAPIKLVFEAFSVADHLSQWWGPAGYKFSVKHFDFRPGGLFLFKMESGAQAMWARFIYGEIKEPELIEFILSFSDEKGGITRAPFFEEWPLEMKNEVRFSEKDGKTTVVLKSYPVNATEKEISGYLENKSSFRQGTNASFDQLELVIAKLK